jgi:hypothetical protein
VINVKVSSNAGRVFKKYRKLAKNIRNFKRDGTVRSFLNQKRTEYRTRAQEIVLDEVYRAYQPKEYQRTFNLFNAVLVSQLDRHKFTLHIPLTNSLEMDRPNSNHQYYPMLVIEGITSVYPVEGYPRRDFYYSPSGWLNVFGKRFSSDYYKAVIRGMLR